MSLLDPKLWTGRISSGGWVTSQAGDAAVVEPATGAELGRVGIANAADVRDAVRKAAQAQRDWAETNFEERAAVLRRAGALFEQYAEDIHHWIIRETGSVPPKAGLETHVAAQECYEAAALASGTTGEILPTNRKRLEPGPADPGRGGRGDRAVQRAADPRHPRRWRPRSRWATPSCSSPTPGPPSPAAW